jgi:ABC-type phosphate transport system auxiliary subunit
MKHLIVTALLACGSAFAANTADSVIATPVAVQSTSRLDSIISAEKAAWQADSAKYAALRKTDSIKFDTSTAKLPDSVRAAIALRRAEIDARIVAFQKLTAAEIKVKLDSLEATRLALRDSVIALLPAAEQAKIKAHVALIDAKRAELKARIEATRAEIEKRIQAAKAATANSTNK